MGEAIEVDGGESPFTAQIIFSAIEKKKKRREKVVYLLRKERAYRTLWPRALASSHPSAQTFKKLIHHFLI